MNCSTLAELTTEALMGLGMPSKQYCEVEDAARAVVHALALVGQHTTYSAQNLALSSYEWTPASRDESLSGAAGIQIPAWVERKAVNSVEPFDFWHFVPTCNLADLEPSRLRGQDRCAFYSKNGQLRIKLSLEYLDFGLWTYRLWYSTSPIAAETFDDTALDAASTSIPQNFFPMISGMAELELIPTMMIRASDTETPNLVLIKAWTTRMEYLNAKVAEWKDRLKHFANGNRGQRRGRRRRNILPGRVGI